MIFFGKKKEKFSLGFIAFLQALGLFVYCTLVALLMLNGNKWFGPVPNIMGPMIFLTLFAASALICGLLVGTYPFVLFWEKKKTTEAIKLLIYTAVWLAVFVLGILFFLVSNR